MPAQAEESVGVLRGFVKPAMQLCPNWPCGHLRSGHAGGVVDPQILTTAKVLVQSKNLFRLKDSLGQALLMQTLHNIYLLMASCYREYAIYIVDWGL
jgi:hypothetical protein